MPKLMDEIRGFKVPRRSLALWFLGQNGWILKSPSGFTVAIDPYLTDSLKGSNPKLDTGRLLPVFIPPDELRVDLYACTHSHRDHADPASIEGCRAAGCGRFMGPAETQARFKTAGVTDSDRILTWPNHVIEFADIRFTGTFALPTDHTDLTHMGFFIEVDGGAKVYITGDTADCDLLQSVGRLKPDVMLACINAGFNNLSHWQAAALVKAINPKVAIPCHYDMFADNSCPPHLFKASLTVQAIGEKYHHLAHATPFVCSVD
jgi:L-ascorbate 6-phosphate lactonase